MRTSSDVGPVQDDVWHFPTTCATTSAQLRMLFFRSCLSEDCSQGRVVSCCLSRTYAGYVLPSLFPGSDGLNYGFLVGPVCFCFRNVHYLQRPVGFAPVS